MKRIIQGAFLTVCVIVMSVAATTVVVGQGKKPPPPPAPRFVDNLNGTITDKQTGLMWDKKTGTHGPFIQCSTTRCRPAGG